MYHAVDSYDGDYLIIHSRNNITVGRFPNHLDRNVSVDILNRGSKPQDYGTAYLRYLNKFFLKQARVAKQADASVSNTDN